MKTPYLIASICALNMAAGCSGLPDGGEPDVAVETGVAQEALTDQTTRLEPASPLELQRMTRYLENYAPADAIVDSYQLGPDWIDCVEIERQFGLRGSGLSSEEIPRAPSDADQAPTVVEEPKVEGDDSSDPPVPEVASQLPQRGYGCPPDSIPVVRRTIEELGKYPTLDAWLDRRPKPLTPGDHGYNWRAEIANNIGMTANLNLWQPTNNTSDEFSEMQTWLIGCTMDSTRLCSTDLQSIESGWMSWGGFGLPDEPFTDNQTRSFLFTTADDYQAASNCWNLECSQFVQTNNLLVIGGTFSSLSSFGGTQYEMPLTWHRDTTGDHHWWLAYNGTWIGYYKNNDSWFDSPGLQTQAADMEVGAEVIVDDSTFQAMGSGKCPSDYSGTSKYAQAAFVSKIQRNTTGWTYVAPTFTEVNGTTVREDAPFNGMTAVNDPYGSGTAWKTHFFVGGEKFSNCEP